MQHNLALHKVSLQGTKHQNGYFWNDLLNAQSSFLLYQTKPPVTHKGVVSKNISRSCRRYCNIFAEVQYCRILYQGFLSFYRFFFFFQESDFAKSKLSLAWRKTHLTVKKNGSSSKTLILFLGDLVLNWKWSFFSPKKSRQQQLVMISFQKLPSIKQTERKESTYFLTDSLATSFFGWDLYLKCQNISIIGSRSW